MKIKNLIIFSLFISSLTFAETEIEKAAELYKNGNYSQALNIYQSELAKNPKDPYLLFNAGNCFYKQGNYQMALVYFIRAFKILPRNKEIKYNMEFVAKQTGQNLFSQDVPQIFYNLYYFFSDAELKTLSMLFLFLFFLISSLLFWEKYRDKATEIMLISGILFLLFFSWMTLRKNSIFYSPGIIMVDNTQVLSGPGNNFKVAATINSPKIVQVIDLEDKEYVEIGILEEGIKGWVKKENIEVI